MENIELIMITISAIASAIAAVTASITTWQNHKSIQRQELERHAMVKPQFVVTNTFINSVKKELIIDVKNIGYNILNDIVAKWDGPEKVCMDFNRYLEEDKTITYSIVLRINEDNCDGKDIKCRLTLTYLDILGGKYNDSIDFAIKKVFNDVGEMYCYKLENITNRNFT